MLKYTTGNNIVDAMTSVQLTGNIIPQIWYQTIARDNGKPHLLAISILADICYWYRPAELRDPESGCFLGYQKKFSGDLLQRSYQQLSDLFGESKRSVTEAVVRLERIGVVERVFRTVIVNGTAFNNVLFLKLNPEKLYEITYPKSDEEPERTQLQPEEIPSHTPSETPPTKFRERGHIKKGEGSQNNVTRNTENTIEITQKDISSSSILSPPVLQAKADDDDERIRGYLQEVIAMGFCPPELVNQVYHEILRTQELKGEMTLELFVTICRNITTYASEVVNMPAYITKCLENLLAGKRMGDMIEKEKSRASPDHARKKKKNMFNEFMQRQDYDIEAIEKDMVYATSHKCRREV